LRKGGTDIEADTNSFALSASTLIGAEVRNSRGEDLGKIDEIMIDVRRGCVAYVVVSFGGALGLGDKMFAVPWQILKIDAGNERVVLDVEPEVLENAPGLDEDESEDWVRQLYVYYGHAPYW
jgi:sporulation protein YlmC with PRC-barrel domain